MPHNYSTCVLTTDATHGWAFLALTNSPLGSPRVVFSLKLLSQCNDWSLEEKEARADVSKQRPNHGSIQGNPSFIKRIPPPPTTGLGEMSSWNTEKLGSALVYYSWRTVALKVLGGDGRRRAR